MAETIRVYFDETYLHKHSGIVHAVIPIPDDSETEITEAINSLKEEFPNMPTELKAKNISVGNQDLYEQFLIRVVNVLGMVSASSSLRGIITFESKARREDKNYKYIKSQVDGALANLKVVNCEYLASEFCKQIWWIWRFFGMVCPTRISESFEFIYDEKYSYAALCRSKVWVTPVGGIPVLWECRNLFTSIANNILPLLGDDKRRWFPQIKQHSFASSVGNRMLQCCDLMSNLFYNTL
ncbi:MAG: hypothetical protein WCI73_14345, partial [Phycisphaerae bacterium]